MPMNETTARDLLGSIVDVIEEAQTLIYVGNRDPNGSLMIGVETLRRIHAMITDAME